MKQYNVGMFQTLEKRSWENTKGRSTLLLLEVEGDHAQNKAVKIKNWGVIVQTWQFCKRWQLLSLKEYGTPLQRSKLSAPGLAGILPSLRGGILPLSVITVHSSQMSAYNLRRSNFFKVNDERQDLGAPRSRMQQPPACHWTSHPFPIHLLVCALSRALTRDFWGKQSFYHFPASQQQSKNLQKDIRVDIS